MGFSDILSFAGAPASAFNAVAGSDFSVTQGVDTLWQDPDNLEWQREEMKRLIAEIEGDFPAIRRSIRSQNALQRASMIRQLQDYSAAGRVPQNVAVQNKIDAYVGSRRNLDFGLAQYDIEEDRSRLGLAELTRNVAPTNKINPLKDLLSSFVQIGSQQMTPGGQNQYGGY